MEEQSLGEGYDSFTEWQKAQESREELDQYLCEMGFEPGEVRALSNIKKRDFLLQLCECLEGNISVSDSQRRLSSKGVHYISYPDKEDPMLISCKNNRGYIIYPTNVYAYRAFSGNGSLVAIAGRFKDNLTDEEKSRSHSEHLFTTNQLGNTICRLLLTCPPFNPLYLYAYGSNAPEVPEELSNLIQSTNHDF